MNEEQAALYRRWLLGRPQCGDYCDTCGDCLYHGGEICINGGDHSWVIYPDLTDDEKSTIEEEVKRERADRNP